MKAPQLQLLRGCGTILAVLLLQSCTTYSFNTASGKRKPLESIQGGRIRPTLSWRFIAHGPLGAPAISDGIVYVGCRTRSDTSISKNYFYAIDAKTGAKRWFISTTGDPSGSPLVTKGSVYWVSEYSYPRKVILISLDTMQGKERWRRPLDGIQVGEIKWNRNGSLAIVTANNRAGDSYRGVVRHSINPNTGQVLRQRTIEKLKNRKAGVSTPPLHALALQWESDVVYWGDSFQFQAFNKKTAKELWSVDHPSSSKSSKGRGKRRSRPWFFPPVVSDDVVFVGGNAPYLHAVHATTGQIYWKVGARGNWAAKPLIAVGTVLLYSDLDRTIYAVNRKTGRVLWKITEEERSTAPGEKGIIGHGCTGVAADENGLYLSSANEILYGYRF
jgi:outer membrane protein assembly factor BamB